MYSPSLRVLSVSPLVAATSVHARLFELLTAKTILSADAWCWLKNPLHPLLPFSAAASRQRRIRCTSGITARQKRLCASTPSASRHQPEEKAVVRLVLTAVCTPQVSRKPCVSVLHRLFFRRLRHAFLHNLSCIRPVPRSLPSCLPVGFRPQDVLRLTRPFPTPSRKEQHKPARWEGSASYRKVCRRPHSRAIPEGRHSHTRPLLIRMMILPARSMMGK